MLADVDAQPEQLSKWHGHSFSKEIACCVSDDDRHNNNITTE